MTTTEQPEIQDERRGFFRIDDSIQVSYRQLEKIEQPPLIDQERSGSFTIMTRLQAISQHLSASLHRIEQRDPDVADYLKALEEKITLLGQSLLTQEADLMSQSARAVNLSASGLALESAEKIDPGTQVEIKLLLLPSYTGVIAWGEVVGVDPANDNADYPYRLRINFTQIQDVDRDALIRHILWRQSQLLRQQRERKELADEKA